MKPNRRQFIKGVAAAAPASMLPAAAVSQVVPAPPDYFADLGVRPFINAIGPYSSLGGAQMWPEVIDAMDYAIRNKARMSDLHDAVGRRIAALTGAESAMVTAGATCAMLVGVAACMTMGDREKMERLPDSSGMPNEIIIQKGQRYLYDRSLKAPGASLVEVETAADIRNAIGPQTAMLFFLANRQSEIDVHVAEFVALGKEYGVPTFCDAATTVPPIKRMFETVEAGFDLICYSGGKGLRGPYSAGLLLGREDLIRYARANSSPNHRAYGRSMKVAPEEYLGMLVALETSIAFDEDAEFARQLAIIEQIGSDIGQLPDVVATVEAPDHEAREPYLVVEWDKSRYRIDEPTLKQALRDGDPAIEIRALFLSGGRIELTAVMLKPGEPASVARRVRELLEASV